MNIESILNVTCSRAVDIQSKPIDCNLLEELQNNKYQVRQDEIRAEPDPDKQDALKSEMPVLLPSCQCRGTKSKSSIIKHTGLIAIDIDQKDNLNVPNFHELKEQFCKIPNIAYCGLSVRGKGYFLLIPIAHPDKHELHFKWLQMYFKASGLNIDPSGVNVNRLRFYSYDPDAYYHHSAKPLQSFFVPPVIVQKEYNQKTFDADKKPVWDLYNEGLFFIEVLESHGWKIESRKGTKIFFTRPGKGAGVSAEYDSNENVFYVFTSNGQPFEGGKGYNPFNVYSLLNHNGDHSKAAKSLKNK